MLIDRAKSRFKVESFFFLSIYHSKSYSSYGIVENRLIEGCEKMGQFLKDTELTLKIWT